jgi:hypothetical protein
MGEISEPFIEKPCKILRTLLVRSVKPELLHVGLVHNVLVEVSLLLSRLVSVVEIKVHSE